MRRGVMEHWQRVGRPGRYIPLLLLRRDGSGRASIRQGQSSGLEAAPRVQNRIPRLMVSDTEF
jgi:hypothetical protein